MERILSVTPDAAVDPLDTLRYPPEHAGMVELRLDLFPGIDPRAAVAACPLPLVATLRSTAEGGQGPIDPVARRRLLGDARDAGAALLDLELERDLPLIPALGLEPERTIVSWHDPLGTPLDLDSVAARLEATPARWLKLVPTAHVLADVVALLDLLVRSSPRRPAARRLLAFAMGPVGLPTRYLGPLLGAPLTFVARSAHTRAAPGQLPIDVHVAAADHLQGPPQRLFLVVGADVGRSSSPVLHGAGYAAMGLPYLMIPVNVPDPTDLGLLFRPLGDGLFDRLGLPIHGLAVTTPFKDAAAAAATTLAPRARRAGAVNTLVPRQGSLLGDTTDGDGVVGALTAAGIDPSSHHALVQGTGGAGRAAALGLHAAGSMAGLRGRNAARTEEIARTLEVGWWRPDESPPAGTILVNATPPGSREDPVTPFARTELEQAIAVVEMVYADGPTSLEREARALGRVTVDGLDVLAHQGFAQFAAFTGVLPPRERMLIALRGDDPPVA